MPECMADDGNKAVFVGTFLTNGESVALCDEHMVYFCASTLQEMTGIDPVPFVAAISEPKSEGEDMTSDWKTAPADIIAIGPGDGSAYEPFEAPQEPQEDPEEVTPDPTPPTPLRGRMRAVSSGPPTDGAGEQDATTAEAASATPAT